jgi:hypothetical protein
MIFFLIKEYLKNKLIFIKNTLKQVLEKACFNKLAR